MKPSKDNVSITALLFKKKTVDLTVPVEGLESAGFQRSVSVPKTITIKGSDSVLSSIENITCQTVDLRNVYEDTKIKLVPILSSGVNA